MAFCYRSPREFLYVLEDFTTGAHIKPDFVMGFRYRSPREILYARGGCITGARLNMILLWDFTTGALWEEILYVLEDGASRSSERCPNDAQLDTTDTPIASGWKESGIFPHVFGL